MDEAASEEIGLPVCFLNQDLLRLALVHSSYLNENPEAFSESNERLEFLGDAVIGMVIADLLYEMFPDKTEGALTVLRSALVNGETLARTARSLDLGEHLLMGKGEEADGGRRRESNLAAAFEALVGALFLDRGYETARTLVGEWLSPEMSAVRERGLPLNPKSLLQEVVQGKGESAPSYRVVEEAGRDDSRRFTSEVVVSGRVLGRGSGRRKSLAEQEAAREALKKLGRED